jgi:diguanylate cyclase (GGDEF)-like protein
MPWYPPELNDLRAVAAADIGADGVLRAGNAGFLHLLPQPGEQFVGKSVAHFLIQPRFSALVNACVPSSDGAHQGLGHVGLFTVGDALDRPRSLRGTWRCVQGRYQLLAEHDIDELERLSTVLLDVNETYQKCQQVLSVSNQKLRHREAEILAVSQTDALTGVGNRRYLDEVLRREAAHAAQTGQPLTVVMTDLDHFKRVNDTHGHQAGDAVLAAFGALLQQFTRTTDVVARFGGEEFVVLMPGTSRVRATEWAERMRQRWAQVTVPPLKKPVTVSLGVAALNPRQADVQDLLHRADAALYRAKRTGRNRVVTDQAFELAVPGSPGA